MPATAGPGAYMHGRNRRRRTGRDATTDQRSFQSATQARSVAVAGMDRSYKNFSRRRASNKP